MRKTTQRAAMVLACSAAGSARAGCFAGVCAAPPAIAASDAYAAPTAVAVAAAPAVGVVTAAPSAFAVQRSRRRRWCWPRRPSWCSNTSFGSGRSLPPAQCGSRARSRSAEPRRRPSGF